METTISHNYDEEHWYDKNDPFNPKEKEDPNAKRRKVKRGAGHIIINVLLRLYGLIISVLMIAMGAYLEFLIKDHLSPYLKLIEFALMGAFFIVCGVLTLLIETRTRRTMKHCLSAYFFLGNSLARGLFYGLVGGLTFVQKYEPPYVKGWWVGCAILGCAACNLIYYPFYWGWKRDRDINHNTVIQTSYPEEDIYGLTMYIKNAQYDPKMMGGNATRKNYEPEEVPAESKKDKKGKEKKEKKDKHKSDKKKGTEKSNTDQSKGEPVVVDEKGKGVVEMTEIKTIAPEDSSSQEKQQQHINPEPSGAEITVQ